jgi:hypothetical protein
MDRVRADHEGRGLVDVADFFKEAFDDSAHAAQRRASAVRKPWWQLAKTVRQGYLMSGGYFVVAAGALIVSVTGPGSSVAPRMFAVLWLGFSIWCLVSMVALRRRQQRGHEIGTPSEDGPGLPPSSR